MNTEKLQEICPKMYEEMRAQAAPWQDTWKELCAYLAPTRGCFNDAPNRGRRIDHQKLIDSEPMLAVEVLSAGMVSGLTCPSRAWFELGSLEQETPALRPWLYQVKKQMENVFSRSNVYSALHSFYQEIAVFGTAAFLLEEDEEKILFCRSFTAGEYVLGCDEKGRVNRFGREFFMTPEQMAEKFGEEKLPLCVRQLYRAGNRAAWQKVCHLIFPNSAADSTKKNVAHMAYNSVYFTPKGEILKESGYREFPVIAARWEVKNTSDVYGRGPGWKCLGDVKMLQKMQKTKLVALDKNTNPPMMVSSNVQGEVNLLPGGLTRYSGTADSAVKPAYLVPVDLQALDMSIEKVKQTIKSQFFADVFLMLSSQNFSRMTAAEVAERHQEKMLVLGPVLERLKNELLDPLIERAFAILWRRGLLPLPPQEAQGSALKVNYISMIAQAQKATGMGTIMQGAAFAASLAATNPDVLDNVNFDAAVQEGLTLLGVPPAMLRAPQEAHRLRSIRQGEALAAQMGAAAQKDGANSPFDPPSQTTDSPTAA